MSMRYNAAGQVESVKTVPREHVSVVDSRNELLDQLGRAQAEVVEIQQDLAEYDALVASAAQPTVPTAPADQLPQADTPVVPEVPAVDPNAAGGVQ